MYVQLFGDEDVFGSLQMAFYGHGEYPDVQERIHGDYADCSGEFAPTDTVFEIGNLHRLQEWAIIGVDRRQGQLLKYIASLKSFGVARAMDMWTFMSYGRITEEKKCR